MNNELIGKKLFAVKDYAISPNTGKVYLTKPYHFIGVITDIKCGVVQVSEDKHSYVNNYCLTLNKVNKMLALKVYEVR